jgi:hypothetical protein
MGRAVAQADSRQPLTTEASPRSQASPCEIYGGQALREVFLHVVLLSVATVIPPALHNDWFTCYWRNAGLATDTVAKQHIKTVLFLSACFVSFKKCPQEVYL